MRRIERLINLIAALLESSRPMTAEGIRDSIAGYDQQNQDAFRRAFERDKSALRAMGIPLEVVPVPGDEVDGYTIPKDKYYVPDLDLDTDELAALRLVAGSVLGAGGVTESGLLKLSVDAPTGDPGGPRIVWGADVAVEQPLLRDLYAALLDRAAVRFTYEAADGSVSARTVDGYGLVHRTGHWYVVGRDASRDGVRSFKLSRIRGAIEMAGSTYEIPDDFNAGAHLGGEPWEIGDDAVPVTVRFDADLGWWARQNMGDVPMQDAPGGAVEITIEVANLDALVSWVVGFGAHVEIVAPPEARQRVIEHLRPLVGSA